MAHDHKEERGRLSSLFSLWRYTTMSKLFVGNLSWSTTDASMKAFFETIGEVISARVVLERETRRSRGFGFVEMANTELAERAIAELNDKELDGRAIRVNMAMEREEGTAPSHN